MIEHTKDDRQAAALAVFTAAGIDVQNSRPDGGPRRYFADGLPVMRGLAQLELVAGYLDAGLRHAAEEAAAYIKVRVPDFTGFGASGDLWLSPDR